MWISQGLNPCSKELSTESPEAFHQFTSVSCSNTTSRDTISPSLPPAPLGTGRGRSAVTVAVAGALAPVGARRDRAGALERPSPACQSPGGSQFICFPKHNIAPVAANLANPLIHHLNPGQWESKQGAQAREGFSPQITL